MPDVCEATSPKAERPPRKRRWLQFRLRTLLLLATVCALALGQIGFCKVWEERRAAQQFARLGFAVTWEMDPNPPSWSEVMRCPTRFREAVWRRFEHVVAVGSIAAPRPAGNPPYALPKDLSCLTNLRYAELWDDGASGTNWGSLAAAPCLRRIVFKYAGRFEARPSAWLLECKRLEEIESVAIVDENTMKLLGKLTNLRALKLWDCTPVSDAGFEPLKNLQNLETLFLVDTRIGDDGLRRLASLRRLKTLGIGGTCDSPGAAPSCATDKGLRSLASLPHLEALLASTNVRGLDLGEIQSMSSVKTLILCSPSFTDTSVKELAKIKRISQRSLMAPGIGPDAACQLRNLGWDVWEMVPHQIPYRPRIVDFSPPRDGEVP